MFAALQLSNLLYVAAAIAVASLISALIALRHRRPKSLESGVELFSRELRALAPEGDPAEFGGTRTVPGSAGIAVGSRHTARPGETRVAGRRPQGGHYREPLHVSDDGGLDRAARGRDEPSVPPPPPGRAESGSRSGGPEESMETEGQAG